jgi:hypothetical protein
MTLYLIDANVLIRADADFYPIDRVPQFWDWLLEKALEEAVKMPREIYDEVAPSKDQLGQWLRNSVVKEAIILADKPSRINLQSVLDRGYGQGLTDVDLEKIGRDPFLIAAAMGYSDRVVVTREVSKPSALKANRKVPDVCKALRIEAINDYELYRRLKFSTR